MGCLHADSFAVSSLLQARFSARNPAIVKALVLRNQQIIDDLDLQFQTSDGTDHLVPVPSHEQHQRPRSPVKLLSNFLHQPASSKKLPPPVNLIDAPPPMRPAFAPRANTTAFVTKPASSNGSSSRPTSRDDLSQRPESAPELVQPPPFNPFKRLEETMSAYFLALQARKGNIVGRIVQSRSRALELSVNELYNSLLEDPNMMVVAAQSSIDVLFASFEKFLKVAWKEHCGPVISLAQLNDIQKKAESLFPVDFERYFKDSFHQMSIQNQRALKGFVKLLAELLDGTGNDGDRGMLTMAFVEILVSDGEPHAYVSLLDRFVDDMESLFGEVVVVRDVQPTSTKSSSVNSRHTRSRSVNTGSLTSNTSSLRKKFGFSTLGRDNGRSEPESKVGSVFRALSKSTRIPDQPHSLTREPFQRAQSSDIDTLARVLPARPASSHERQPPGSSSSDTRPRSHPAPFLTDTRPRTQEVAPATTVTSSPGGLGSIQEATTPRTNEVKKKRRSSLTDLKTLEMAIGDSPFMSPSTMLRFNPNMPESEAVIEPSSPMENKSSTFSTPSRIGGPPSPQRSRLPSSFRRDPRENSPRPERKDSTTTRPRGLSKMSEEMNNSPKPERAYSTTTRPRGFSKVIEEEGKLNGLSHTSTMVTRPRSLSKQPDEVTITPLTPHGPGSIRRGEFPSGIPSLRGTPTPIISPSRTGLSERPNTGNAMKINRPTTPGNKFKSSAFGSLNSPPSIKPSPFGSLHSPPPKPSNMGSLNSPPPLKLNRSDFGSLTSPPSTTRKLRMQSPQKLRERLQDEQRALSNAHSTLQDELSKIGEEMSGLGPGRHGSVRGSRIMSPPLVRPGSKDSNSGAAVTNGSSLANANVDAAARLAALEASLPTLLTSLQDRIAALATDITTSLTVSETKARKLDELYREANAENEALYCKVNEELAKVLRGVRGGDGVGEIKRKLKESQEEEGRLRRENARLKREVLGLRSQLRE